MMMTFTWIIKGIAVASLLLLVLVLNAVHHRRLMRMDVLAVHYLPVAMGMVVVLAAAAEVHHLTFEMRVSALEVVAVVALLLHQRAAAHQVLPEVRMDMLETIVMTSMTAIVVVDPGLLLVIETFLRLLWVVVVLVAVLQARIISRETKRRTGHVLDEPQEVTMKLAPCRIVNEKPHEVARLSHGSSLVWPVP
jgi:hypothetical protein